MLRKCPKSYADDDWVLDNKVVEIGVSEVNCSSKGQTRVNRFQDRCLSAISRSNKAIHPRARRPTKPLDASEVLNFEVSDFRHC